MNRRQVLQNMALASAATFFLPGCSEKNVMDLLVNGQLQLDDKHSRYLSAISEAFLPVRGISENIDSASSFIMTMVNDTYAPEDILKFASGFQNYKQVMKDVKAKILKVDTANMVARVTALLESEEIDPDLGYFIHTTKQLSIRNFTSSEYFLVNYEEYQMIPPTYEACVDVQNLSS